MTVETTNVFGCSTKWTDKTDSARKAIEKWDAEPVAIKPIDAAAVKGLTGFDIPDAAKEAAEAREGKSSGRAGRHLCLDQRMGHLVRPLRDRTTRTRHDPAHVPQPRVGRRHDQHRRHGKKGRRPGDAQKQHVAATNYIWSTDDKECLVAALDKEWHGPVPHTILIAPGGESCTGDRAFDVLELKKAIVGYLGKDVTEAPVKTWSAEDVKTLCPITSSTRRYYCRNLCFCVPIILMPLIQPNI